jgi:hypothetical protein
MPFGVRNTSANDPIEVDGASFVAHSWTLVPDVTDVQAAHPSLRVVQVAGEDDVRLAMYPVIVHPDLLAIREEEAAIETPEQELERLRAESGQMEAATAEIAHWKSAAEAAAREVKAARGELAKLKKSKPALQVVDGSGAQDTGSQDTGSASDASDAAAPPDGSASEPAK